MHKKQSEREFKEFCNRYGIDSYKYPDRRRCPACGKLLWKVNRMPDYEITHKGIKSLVEVKQGSKRWYFASEETGIRGIQREKLDDHMRRHNMPWVFLALGEGRAPNGRGAFLIPWAVWKRTEEMLLSEGQKSIRFEGGRMKTAKVILAEYRLVWKDSGWSLPEGHIFWNYLNPIQFDLSPLCQPLKMEVA